MLAWLLAALAVPARCGITVTSGFSCWKPCGSRGFLCSWAPLGPAGNTSYLLTLCYTTPRLCQRFEVGTKMTHTLKHHNVYVLTNTTAWVEARWGDRIHRTPNLTLYLNEAVKLNPPPDRMPFTKTGGQLRLRGPWPLCRRISWPLQREARFQRMGDRSWMQVTCESVMDKNDSVICALGRDGAFEVQLRHKTSHWSSYWSDWSSSIFIPEEILASPALNHQLGQLGRDGQRVLRLSWQRAPKEQGNVTYTLRTRMSACRCAERAEEDAVVLETEVTAHDLILSGAEYEILLTAANAAGPGPVQRLRVPAERHADLGFKDITVTGGTMTAQWVAPSHGLTYCFEQQPLPGEPKRGVCIQRDFPAESIHVERVPVAGALGAPACHRLAVHGRTAARGWTTFAVQHHYAGNASLAVPFHINTSTRDATTVVLWWKPSPRAACPGVLAKYLICHAAKGDNVTYVEANATASRFTLHNLRPGTAYGVGVWEVTAESGDTCSAQRRFQTKALGPQGAAWKSNLNYLAISLGLPVVAVIYQLSKKRARRLLFPPLPAPVGTKAVEFSTDETSQGHPRPGLVEPLESFSPAELLITETSPGEETTTDANTRPCTPQPGPVAEEPVVVSLLGCEKEQPFTYRRQEVLSPVGFPPPGSTSCAGHPGCEEEEEEEEEEGRQGLHQPLVPITLLISDKPIIIRDEEGWDPSPEESVP